MPGARSLHRAVRLASEQVLVVGGLAPGEPSLPAILFDPGAGMWSATEVRTDHAAHDMDVPHRIGGDCVRLCAESPIEAIRAIRR